MRKIEPEFITGMGYIGASPGVLYHMGGAGEQTVVTGNPAMLEGVKGSRFTSLTLHGKSTQGSTTGAQLLPFEVGEKREGFEVFKDGIAISVARKKDIYAVGRDGMTNESSYDDFPLLASGEYYVYSDSASVNLIVAAFRNGINITLGSSMKGVAAKIKVMDGDKFRIFLRLEEAFNGKVKAMISKTQPTASNYEPYTGGKPSPSPEYPQEIKSVGQDGEIALNVLGKNLIPFPYPELGGAGVQTEKEGVKYTVQGDGGIRCTGTPSSQFGVIIARIAYSATALSISNPSNGKIVLSGGELYFDPKNNALFIYYNPSQVGKPLDTVFYPQIELGTVATSYEKYKPVQKLIIPASGGLPGIPVSSGGNYTDEKGQQWVCNEVDFKKGVYVQRVAKEIPQTSFTVRETFDNEGRYQFMYAFKNIYKNGGNKCLISHGIYESWGTKKNSWTMNTNSFYYFPAERTTVDKIKEKILSLINSDNPLTFLGQLETPIEIPLTTEQLAKYKALRTYSPTTTVINDAGAGMSVGYKRRK
jgi:hypothetical protein